MSVSCECCEVEVSASGRTLVRKSSTECVVSECDHEALITRRPWPTRSCCTMGKKRQLTIQDIFLTFNETYI